MVHFGSHASMLHMTYKEVLAHYGCQIRARVQIFQTFAQHGSQDRALAQKVQALAHLTSQLQQLKHK